MKQMIKNWREIESLGNFLYRDANGNVRITEPFFDLNGNNPLVVQNLKDGADHKRFIEDAISVEEQTGLTINYAKWSLSGSHLMIVIAGTVSAGNTAVISLKSTFNNLPSWILSKIFPLGTGDNVAYSTLYKYDSENFSVTTEPVILIKSDTLNIFHENSIGSPTDRIDFRVAFDLLIDMAS